MLSTVFTAAFVKHNNKIVSDEHILGYAKKSWYLRVTLKKKKEKKSISKHKKMNINYINIIIY